MTEVAEPSTAAGVPAPAPRPRAATDLPLASSTATLVDVDRGSRPASRPGSADDRLAALEAFEALPIEPNQLYTPYVDLRAADLGDVVAYEPTPGTAAGASAVPEGTAATALVRRGRRAVDRDSATPPRGRRARRAARRLRRARSRGRPRPARPTPLLPPTTGSPSSAARPGARACVVHVPAGVRVERPIVVRWSVGAPGRALHRAGRRRPRATAPRRRSSRRSSPPTPPCPASQALFTSTTEVRLGAGARLAMASLQEAGPDQVVFQQRRADDRRGRGPPLGARAARRPARPLPRRQRPRGRPEHGRAGRDRVRRRRPAPRPHLVHAPRRPRHDGPAPVQGRAARQGPQLPQGPDHDRAERRSGPTATSASSG